MDIFSDDNRRNPYPLYAQMRSMAPVFKVPLPFDAWMIFDYDGVKRALSDHESFSNRVPAPANWFIFEDPPKHTKLRVLVSKAFTPRMSTNLEPLIRELSRSLLDKVIDRGGRAWSDDILKISAGRGGGDEAKRVMKEFADISAAMNEYLTAMIARRRQLPTGDLLSHLVAAEVDGKHLAHDEILGFFQLLVVGGQETTANLINCSGQICSFCLPPSRRPCAIVRRCNGCRPKCCVSYNLQFRAAACNMPNHPVFDRPGFNNLGNAAWVKITGLATQMPQIQCATKLLFSSVAHAIALRRARQFP